MRLASSTGIWRPETLSEMRMAISISSTLVIHWSTISVNPKHLGALNCGLYGVIWIWTTLSYAFPLAVFLIFPICPIGATSGSINS
jgi:hypothetical protein